MQEGEAGRVRHQIRAAPANHPLVQVEPGVLPRTRSLLQHLPRQPAASASEIEHVVETLGRHAEDRRAARILKRRLVGRPDELAHFERGNRERSDVPSPGHAGGSYCFSYTCVLVYATPDASVPCATTVRVLRSDESLHVALSLPTSAPSSVRSIVAGSTRFNATMAAPQFGIGYGLPSNFAVYEYVESGEPLPCGRRHDETACVVSSPFRVMTISRRYGIRLDGS